MKLLPALLLLGACTDAPTTGASFPLCSGNDEPCLDRITTGDRKMPIYRNVSLTAPNAAITDAIIVVHGSTRDANNFFDSVLTAATQVGRDESTAIIAPHFQCSDDSPPAGDVFWRCDGEDWTHGFADVSGASAPIYSYAVVDQLVGMLANKAVFPNLSRILVTGLSAGGQLTQRYAAFNAIDPSPGVAIRYLPLSPSTYVYPDATRLPAAASCTITGCTAPFSVPADACAGYDDYFYGLQHRDGYVGAATAAEIQHRLVTRELDYMVGDDDTLANAAGTNMDSSCSANAQGLDRRARALAYWNELRTTYHAAQPLTVVPGCPHSRTCMYFSPQVRDALFPDHLREIDASFAK